MQLYPDELPRSHEQDLPPRVSLSSKISGSSVHARPPRLRCPSAYLTDTNVETFRTLSPFSETVTPLSPKSSVEDTKYVNRNHLVEGCKHNEYCSWPLLGTSAQGFAPNCCRSSQTGKLYEIPSSLSSSTRVHRWPKRGSNSGSSPGILTVEGETSTVT